MTLTRHRGRFIRSAKGQRWSHVQRSLRVARAAAAAAPAVATRPPPRRRPRHLKPPPESAVHRTRAAALWSALTLGFLILIVLLIFIAQNTESTRVPVPRLALEPAAGGGDPVRRGGRRAAHGRGRRGTHLPATPRGEEEPQGRHLAGSLDRHQLVDESRGRSPSTVAVTVMLFSVIAPLWLSRNAVSAASRPVAMRTSDCRGARQRRVDHPPLPVDERLGDRVEVHRLTARRVDRRPAAPARSPRAAARPPDARSRGTRRRRPAACRPPRRSGRWSPGT